MVAAIITEIISLYILFGLFTMLVMRSVQKSKKIKNPIGLILCFILWPIWISNTIKSYKQVAQTEAVSMMIDVLTEQAESRPDPRENMARALAGMTFGDGVEVSTSEDIVDTEGTITEADDQQEE